MPEIAALSVSVTADTSQLEAGLNRANQSVQGFGSQLSGIGAAAGAALAGVGVAAATGIGAAVKTAADFEKQMSAVGAVAGASASEMESLTRAALQLGKDTSFSASEAAQGIEELVKAGVKIGDVIGGGARAALDLAAAGAISVGDAAEIASNAMNVFNLKGSDMAHVADVIAGAANASAIGVNDYKFSLSAAGAVAATVGISFESLSQAIAVMGNAGIKGSDAGTSLKTMMMNLIPTTDKQITLFQRLGILTEDGANAFFDATGKAKSFGEIAQVLQNALKGMTKEQQLATLEIMFGSDAIRAGAVLLDAGAEGFNAIAEAMSKVTAQQVAEERLNNLWGSVEKLKGSLETGAIILGGLFTPAIKTFVDQVTIGVNAGIEILEQLPDAWRTIGQAVAGAWEPSETLTPFMNMVGKVGLAFRAMVGVFRDESGVGIDAVRVLGDVIGDWAQTVNDAVMYAGLAWRTFAPPVIAALQSLGTMLSTHTELVTGFVVAIGSILGMVAVQAVLAAIGAAIALLVSPIGLVVAAITLLVAAWVGNWGGIRDAVLQAWAAMEPTFTALVDWLGTQIPVVLDFLTNTAWPAFTAAAQAVGEFITGTLIPAFTEVVLWLGENIPPVVTWISTVGWPALVSAGEKVGTFITGTLVPAFTEVVTWLGDTIPPVVTWLSDTGWPALVAAGEKVWAVVQEIIKFFQDLYRELEKRGTFEELSRIWDTLTSAGQKLWDIVQKIAEALQPLFDVLSKILGLQLMMLVEFFTGLAEKAGAATRPVEVVAGAIDAFFKIIGTQIKMLETFLGLMDRLSSVKMPSLNFGGGGMGAMSWSGAGSANPDASAAEIDAYIRDAGSRRNMSREDIERAVKMSQLERGAGQARAVGDSGQSFGPFQLYTGGGLGNAALDQGIDVRDPSTWRQQVEFALDQAIKGGWEQWTVGRNLGFTGRPTGTPGGGGRGGLTLADIVPGGRGGFTTGGTHQGGSAADVFAPRGTPIFAPTAGTLRAFTDPKGGNAGILQGEDGKFYYLAHGDVPFTSGRVGAGQAIGAVGNTGNAVGTEPHLHISVSSTGNFPGGQGDLTIPMDGAGAPPMVRIPLAGMPGASPEEWPGFMQQTWEQLPAYLQSLDTIQQSGVGTFTAVGTVGTEQGALLVSSSTDALGNVMTIYTDATGVIGATMTNAAGVIVNQWGAASVGALTAAQTMAAGVTGETATMAAGVAANTNLMATGALTSVTNMGTGILTSVQAAGTGTIATVTDMQGQVTAQYATLANGATLTMGDMAAGVLTSTTDLGTGVMTTVQDMSGNYITTITDLSGNVTAQYTQLATDATEQSVAMQEGVVEAATTMADGTTEEAQRMAADVIQHTDTMAIDAAGHALAMAEQIIADAQTMQQDVSESASSMASGVTGSLGEIVESAGEVQPAVSEMADSWKNLPKPNVSGITKAFDEIGRAADRAASKVDKLADKTGSRSAKEFAKRAAGGPVDFGVPYIVGELGPELFIPHAAGEIVPHHEMPSVRSSGGSGRHDVIELRIDSERIYIEGRDITISRTGAP